jgi:hypothetical protein
MRILIATLILFSGLIMGASPASANNNCVSKTEWNSVVGTHHRLKVINDSFGTVGKRLFWITYERGNVQMRLYRGCNGTKHYITFYRPLTLGTAWHPVKFS